MTNIHSTAIIDDNADIHPSSKISAFVVINGKVKIKENCFIGNHATIGSFPTTENTGVKSLDNDVVIQNNCWIGDGVTIQSGCSNTTFIGENSKINHNSSIGHDVVIGKNCFIGLNNSISGKSVIGNNVTSGPGCTFNNMSKIGDNVRVGIGSLVLHEIEENLVVIGRPARDINLENKYKKKLKKIIGEDYKSKYITSPLGKYRFLRNFLKPIYLILPLFLRKKISNYLDFKRKNN